MKRWLRILFIAFAAIVGLAAWDTLVIQGELPWQSIYQTGDPKSIPEHSSISDISLEYLDRTGTLVSLFGRQGSATLTAVDINASHFREDLLYENKIAGIPNEYGNDPSTKVEERLIPPPANFAGLPDYSYAIYDWLNKNETCPAFNQSKYEWLCHDFFGWLGALNSVHFGSQAQKMYAHHHENALALARQVAELRASMSEEERDVYHDLLLEAEHEALAYEGYAQHFLQDRWAMGHMWERWGSPDASQVDRYLASHLAIGGVSGMIHGTESITRLPDSMSSPLPGSLLTLAKQSTAVPMKFVHVKAEGEPPIISGIGDERLQDAIDGIFRLSRYDVFASDQALNVDAQMESFKRCAGAGWAETIRALGPGDKAGTYGAYKAPLDAAAPSFSIVNQESCWDMWATNQSMATGLLGTNPGQTLALMGSSSIVVDYAASGHLATHAPYYGNRADLVTKATRMWIYGKTNPDGTEIAQGKMQTLGASLSDWFGGESSPDFSDMWGFEQGGHYNLPDYVEPIGLIADTDSVSKVPKTEPLPIADFRGRDIQTLYGAFNQAHSDYWCENRETLNELRASAPGKDQEMCQRLADFAYQGTHPSYTGSVQHTRKHEGAEIRSVCAIHDEGVESDDSDDQDNPYWLDQGYTDYDGEENAQSAFTSIDQVINWCARTPIIKLSVDPELNAENIAAQIRPDTDLVEFAGLDLGTQEGRLTATAPDGTIIELDDIYEWTETRLAIGVSEIDWEENTKYQIKVELAPDGDRNSLETVGLFYLKVDEYVELPIRRQVFLDLGGVGPCGDSVPDIDFIDLAESLPDKENSRAIATMLKTYRKDLKQVKPYLEAQLQCMKSLREERLPIIRDFIENYPENIWDNPDGYKIASPYLQTEHPDTVTDPTYYPNPALRGSLSVEEGYDEPNTWDGDVYTPQIDNLAGTIQMLESVEKLLMGWDFALKDEDAFFNSGERNDNLALVLLDAKDVEEVMETAFIDYTKNRDTRKLVKNRRSRKVQSLRRWESLRIDLGTAGQQITRELKGLPEGLVTWTQTQHTLTQVAIPETEIEIAQLKVELKKSYDKKWDEFWATCEKDELGRCRSYPIYPDYDNEQLSALTVWINDLYGVTRQNSLESGLGNTQLFDLANINDFANINVAIAGRSPVQTFVYRDENGLTRAFRPWPTEADEITRKWPAGLGATRFE